MLISYILASYVCFPVCVCGGGGGCKEGVCLSLLWLILCLRLPALIRKLYERSVEVWKKSGRSIKVQKNYEKHFLGFYSIILFFPSHIVEIHGAKMKVREF